MYPYIFGYLTIENSHRYGFYNGTDHVSNSLEMFPLAHVVFSCIDSRVTLGAVELGSDQWLGCFSASKYFVTRVPGCEFQDLAYGFLVEHRPVVLALVCYNAELKRPSFLHYVAGARSTILEWQQFDNLANLPIPYPQVFINDINLDTE